MKDPRGHGSNPGRGGGMFGHAGISMANNASFSRHVTPWQAQSDTDRTVARMREHLRTSESPGRARVIAQGIRNFLGMK